MPAKRRLVVVGGGMAGIKALEEILAIDRDAFEVSVYSAEAHPNYNRILLSSIISGDSTVEGITLNNRGWFSRNGVTLHLGNPIVEIMRGYKKVVAADGSSSPYDTLILATGSRPVVIPVPGADKEGVFVFRTIEDCAKITAKALVSRSAAVIGGGLLGLEAAVGLQKLGLDVTVIHDQPTLMNLQLDATAGRMLKERLEEAGLRFHLAALTREVLGDGRATGLAFSDGGAIDCDMVVISVGTRPEVSLAHKAHLFCRRGIVVNDYMQTFTDPSIYAVGECTEHRGRTYGLVAPLFAQARVLASHVTGQGRLSFVTPTTSTKLKVKGIDLFSAGDIDGPAETVEYLDKKSGVYKRLFISKDIIKGAILFGDSTDGPRLQKLIEERSDISDRRATLLLGVDAEEAEREPLDADIICGCNGVSKKAIADAIKEFGLTTRKDVIARTKASGSCGGCAASVERILASVNGHMASISEPVCACTSLSHDELKEMIRGGEYGDIKELTTELGWNGEGCHVCLPAINYYLGALGNGMDDARARVVNERLHANIQKDGTFSVIPRVYGGVVSPEELIRIGEVAKKHNVSTVKITGGQRIGLYGIRKEELPEVWRELGMPSGFAYGKALRTVKTCVGERWCRYGTQDSMGLGVKLEKALEGLWTPAKMKLAVSGCPRNCAEATVKDLSVVGVKGGWEIYCGGNGGIRLRGADHLCTAKDEAEVLEVAKAFIALYRDDARYGERTSEWIERVGLRKIKDGVVDDLRSRRVLAEKLADILSGLGVDPWEERVRAKEDEDGYEASDYTPIELNMAEVEA